MTARTEINKDFFIKNVSETSEIDEEVNNDIQTTLLEDTLDKDDTTNVLLNKCFKSFLIKNGFVYDSNRKLWSLKENSRFRWWNPYYYSDDKNEEKPHNIWACKYENWFKMYYYMDSVGNIVPRLKDEDKNEEENYYSSNLNRISETYLENDFLYNELNSKKDDKKGLSLNDILDSTNEYVSRLFFSNKECKRCDKIEVEMKEEQNIFGVSSSTTDLLISEEDAKLNIEFKSFLLQNGFVYDNSRKMWIKLISNYKTECQLRKYTLDNKRWFDRYYYVDSSKNIIIKDKNEENKNEEVDEEKVDKENNERIKSIYSESSKINLTTDDMFPIVCCESIYEEDLEYSISNILPASKDDKGERLLTYFNIKQNKKNQKENQKENNEEEKELNSYLSTAYSSKYEEEYLTHDEMVKTYNQSDINALINVLKMAPSCSSYYSVPSLDRLKQLKYGLKPEYIEYMFQSCYTKSTIVEVLEPSDKQKEIYKNIFILFSDLFSETHSEEWLSSLSICLKTVFQMKRYNMWLLKLLFKDSIRVNMENYQYLLLHNPSSSLLKFVEKHLVDENDNTISVEEMKLKIDKQQNKETGNQTVEKKVEITKVENKKEQQTTSSSSSNSPKFTFNLKWTSGSFECNLMNAHTKLVEENGEYKLEVNLNY